ncbi:MAG: TlpA disulfide reductase family protein [Bacteroidales bacterium]
MTKMYKLGIVFLLALGCVACKPSANHSVIGEIEGLGNDTLYVEYFCASDVETMLYDTLVAANGKFLYDKLFEQTVLMTLTPKQCMEYDSLRDEVLSSKLKQINLIVEPEQTIRVEGRLNPDHLSYKALGSDLMKDYSKIRESTMALEIESERIWREAEQMWAAKERGANIVDSIFGNLLNKAQASDAKVNNLKLAYVKAHPQKMLSALYLTTQPLDTLGVYYETLTAEVKKGVFQGVLEVQYDKYLRMIKCKANEVKMVAGTPAPEFILKDLKGNDVSLSSISMKNKYIVLDFWGSWCSWCIKGFPKMKAYYAKYANKVEFVGIACSDKEEVWKKAVDTYQLPWIQLINGKNMCNDVTVLYGVQGFPTKFILDKNLKIVDRIEGEDPLFYERLDALLQ